MRSTVAWMMTLLLVHLQVVGLTCVCADDDSDDHSAAADRDNVAPAPESPLSHDLDDDADHHGGGPSHCECGPAQPYAAPEPSSLPAGSCVSGWLVLRPDAGLFSPAGEGLRASIPRRARPPPRVRGISSSSPASLPVYLI